MIEQAFIDTEGLFALAREAESQKVWQKKQDRKDDEKRGLSEIDVTEGIGATQIDTVHAELQALEEDITAVETRLQYYPKDSKSKTVLKRLYDHQAVLIRKKNSNTNCSTVHSSPVRSWIGEKIVSLSTKMFRSFFAPVNTPLEQLRQLQWREYRARQIAQGKSLNPFRTFPVLVRMLCLSPMELANAIEKGRKVC